MAVGTMNSGKCLFADVGMMLIEGRVGEVTSQRGFKEGPHCPQVSNSPCHHVCNDSAFLCERASKLRKHMMLLSENCAPMCIDVLLCPDCSCGQSRANSTNICQVASSADILIEQWTVSIVNKTTTSDINAVNDRVLLQALRSQLHFSQLSAWYSLGKVRHVCYRLSHPVGCSGFTRPPVEHNFPCAISTPNSYIKVSLKSLPRMDSMPAVVCPLHSGASALTATVTVFKSVFAELGQCLLDPPARIPAVRQGFTIWRDSKASSPTRRRRQSPPKPGLQSRQLGMLDDRMQSGCKYIGKHHCEDDLEPSPCNGIFRHRPYIHHHLYHHYGTNKESCLTPNDLNPRFLTSLSPDDESDDGKSNIPRSSRAEQIFSAILGGNKANNAVNPLKRKWATGNGTQEACSKKILSESGKSLKERRERRLFLGGGAGSGLIQNDLTESFNRLDISGNKPKSCDNFKTPPAVNRDNNIIKNWRKTSSLAITPPSHHYRSSWTTDSSSEETEGESPVAKGKLSKGLYLSNLRSGSPRRPLLRNCKKSFPLLGNYEENLLNSKFQPVSIIDGFTADLGASGNFCPQHLKLPVVVSFYSFEQSNPYLGVIELSKKGYTIPRSGTVQLTLLNPLGTVIKMFVVSYDVSDMPCNSHTFIRQRIVSDPHRPSNYLIHLRLRSSKSGRITLCSDIKVVLSRQYDIDSSIGLDLESSSSPLKTITIMPSDPKYTIIK